MTFQGLLVQLSDPHITPPDRPWHPRLDTAEALRRAVDAVLALRLPPSAVVVTGDLTDDASPASYRHLCDLLAPLRCPCYLLPGNHDDRATLRSICTDHDYLHAGPVDADPGRPVHYAVDLGGLRLVAMDTVQPGRPEGGLDDTRIQALADTLAAAPWQPTIVAMHHPPFDTGIAHMDAIGLQQPGRLAAVVAAHPRIERVICGHLHRPILRRWAGTLVMTAPGTAHQIHLDLAPDASPAWVLEPPGALLHAWDEQGVVLTHQLTLVHGEGPHPFDDL